MQEFYRICWKHKDFPEHSEGPVLKHSQKPGKPLYTKEDAEKVCRRFNNRFNNSGKVKQVAHWIEERAADGNYCKLS